MEYPQYDLTGKILKNCFEVMGELGSGFLESVYKNALCLVMRTSGLSVVTEKIYDVQFRGHNIGRYKADIVVENAVIVELKCCDYLLLEHQAQLINYLKTAQIPTGLLINFGTKKLNYKRLYSPEHATI